MVVKVFFPKLLPRFILVYMVTNHSPPSLYSRRRRESWTPFSIYLSLPASRDLFLYLKIYYPKQKDLLTIHSNFLRRFCYDFPSTKSLSQKKWQEESTKKLTKLAKKAGGVSCCSTGLFQRPSPIFLRFLEIKIRELLLESIRT